MQKIGSTLVFSAGDLVGHLNCRYLTSLDLKVANGALARPRAFNDPALDALIERGEQHEQGFVEHLATEKGAATKIEGVGIDGNSVAATLQAMRRGDHVIVQAALQNGSWSGRADVLQRVETPSGLGAWSYEPTDSKLARETKGNTVLQLSLYSDLLAAMQGRTPDAAYVVTPGNDYTPEVYRTADYAAFYRRVRRSLEQFASAPEGSAYPDPIEHCDVCRWREHCDTKRRAHDHMSLVAGISKTQISELVRRGVETTAALAALPVPLAWRPDRGAPQSYVKVREQARIQVEGRLKGELLHEVLPPEPGFGLSRLPKPSQGDIFFDFEGDPFVNEGGLEFLFGYLFAADNGDEAYVGDWVTTRQEERAAFEKFIDFVEARQKKYPDLHIYHFAPYEPAALKRLMGRYATREDAVDNLLRAEVFVDLYAVVRHSIRGSVESYSIKKLEPLYKFVRQVLLVDVGGAMARVQTCLELGDAASIDQDDKSAVIGYNREDCASTEALRNWLEQLRADQIKGGATIDRPQLKAAEISEDLNDWKRKVAALIPKLTVGVPDDVTVRTPEQQARWLLAYLLDFFGRENKAVWWEFFRLSDLSAEDLLHERAGLAEMSFLETVGPKGKGLPVHRYRFAVQETDIRADADLKSVGGDKFGTVVAISLDERTIDIKKRKDTASIHPEAVFAHTFINNQVLADAIFRIGEYVADKGIEGPGNYRAGRDLLLRVAPRLRSGDLRKNGESALDSAMRIALSLDQSTFPVQGPPGAGKTHIGARMIRELAGKKLKVGVTANSHKVIRHLLDKAIEAAAEAKVAVQCIQKVSEDEASSPKLQFVKGNPEFIDGLTTTCQVGGATSWFWARSDAAQIVDVLFVDEAAQMSLANVLAASQAAKSIVLLGDPRQLEQPIQGSHPDGVAVSALDHILGEHATIEADRGLFLAETWRMHPDICAFTSEVFYDNRLHSRAGLERQEIKSKGRVNGTGLRYLAVPHEGNQNSSPEEVVEVSKLVKEILKGGATWINDKGKEAKVALSDILIIAPYNAQVFELQEAIPGARIGTVDKFQGQEAPIVIYSMTTSSHADAPRGMEFLYSLNRLNVATSRAKCICVLVASPRVFEAECRTPRQMQLANAFCRYLEMAKPL